MKIPQYILKVLDVLYNNNFEAYLVGGCVRDYTMGITPHDFDLTTNATPGEMLEIFKGYRIIETGVKHGTVTVVSEGNNVEITTYRLDGKYLDNRKPSYVSFTSDLKDDLSRRDFTVNALAYSPRDGLVDMFSSVNDIENKIIRCVGNSDTRFNEDALRILRALRFSSVLGFEIEEKTSESIHNNKHLLNNISKERIYSELKRLITGVRASSVISEFYDVFEIIGDIFKNNKITILKNLIVYDKVSNNYIERFSSLFYNINKNEVYDFLKSLKCDNYTINLVSSLTDETQKETREDKTFIRYLMKDYDEVFINFYINIKKYYDNNFDYDLFLDLYNNQKNLCPCVKIKDLDIKGNDIINLGVKNGKQVGEILDKLLVLVIEDKIANESQLLKSYIKNNFM